MNRQTYLGISLALGTAVISGASNFIAKIGVTVVNNGVVFTALKNSLVAGALIGIILLLKRLPELRKLSHKDWAKLAAIGVVGGGVPFVLFFTGLTHTTALTAGVIHKTLFFWVALLAARFLKERIGRAQTVAFFFLIGGNFVLGGLRGLTFGAGERMILAATIFWAIENVIAKRALNNIPSLVVAGARMTFGSVILFAVVGLQGNFHLIGSLDARQWLWTLIPSALLLGYVLTWYSALRRLSATFATCLLVPATFVTGLLSQVFLDKSLTANDLMSGAVVLAACGVLMYGAYHSTKYAVPSSQRADA